MRRSPGPGLTLSRGRAADPSPEGGSAPPAPAAAAVGMVPPGSALPAALLAAIEASGLPCPGEACDLLRWRE
ncbi:MAG: hypothetical protein AAGC69_15470, partial [Paracraurococcus sp.]